VHCAHLSPHPNHHHLLQPHQPIDPPQYTDQPTPTFLPLRPPHFRVSECIAGGGDVSERTRQQVRSESRDSAEAQPSPPSLVVSAAPVGRPPSHAPHPREQETADRPEGGAGGDLSSSAPLPGDMPTH
jgi:hypothetical protein